MRVCSLVGTHAPLRAFPPPTHGSNSNQPLPISLFPAVTRRCSLGCLVPGAVLHDVRGAGRGRSHAGQRPVFGQWIHQVRSHPPPPSRTLRSWRIQGQCALCTAVHSVHHLIVQTTLHACMLTRACTVTCHAVTGLKCGLQRCSAPLLPASPFPASISPAPTLAPPPTPTHTY